MSLPSQEATQQVPQQQLRQEPLRWLATDVLGRLTPPRVLVPVGLAGTDLGVSFPCGQRLVFLFGDSWTLDRRDWDADRSEEDTSELQSLRHFVCRLLLVKKNNQT